jgi:hypothetical protein
MEKILIRDKHGKLHGKQGGNIHVRLRLNQEKIFPNLQNHHICCMATQGGNEHVRPHIFFIRKRYFKIYKTHNICYVSTLLDCGHSFTYGVHLLILESYLDSNPQSCDDSWARNQLSRPSISNFPIPPLS